MDRIQQAIQALIDSTKHDGRSSVLRAGSGQVRDHLVFDLRDCKIDVLPSQCQLGIGKKWRHEVEICIDAAAGAESSYSCNRHASRLHRLNPIARR